MSYTVFKQSLYKTMVTIVKIIIKSVNFVQNETFYPKEIGFDNVALQPFELVFFHLQMASLQDTTIVTL